MKKMSKEKLSEHKAFVEMKLIKKLSIVLYFGIFSYMLLTYFQIECKQRRIYLNDSIIYLKVKGPGNTSIFSPDFEIKPSEIYINGILSNIIGSYHYLYQTENNVTLIWDSTLYSTEKMFEKCSQITEIDCSKLVTSSVTNMNYMFSECTSLKSLNLSALDTSKVESFNYMFFECSSLDSLNLSNFDTSKLEQMNFVFASCSSISSLDLFNFNTSKVKSMISTFDSCSNLNYLNLSSFNTTKVEIMENMFYKCSSLSSLDLSSFDTPLVTYMPFIFEGCIALKYLILSYFNTSKLESKERIFTDCSSLEYIYIKSTVLDNDLIVELLKANSKTKNICIDIQNDFGNFFTEEQELTCNNTSSNNLEVNIFKCYKSYISSNYNRYYCGICGKNFFNDYPRKCYENPEGYYLDSSDSLYKPCYFSCKKCNIGGNDREHNCLECNDAYKYESQINNLKNCYENESFNIASKTSIIVRTTQNIIETTQNIIETTQNIIETTQNIIETTQNIIETTQIFIETTQNLGGTIPNFIYNFLTELDLSDINNGIDKSTFKDNLLFIFTSTENQKNNKDEKYITMDFPQCEYNLKKDYNIPENESLYILQILHQEKGMKIPKLEYEIYYPLYNNSNNLNKLNLASCKGTKIEISVKVEINDTLDKYNPKSDYYNDICSKATSESGTDICLKDRQNEFVVNNMSLCEENCEFIDYNYTIKKAICSCEIKLEIPKDYDIKFDKKDFFKSFIDINNIINLNIMKCYHVVLKIKDLKKNYGFFIISFIILFYITSLLIFIFYSFYKLKMNISKIVLELKLNLILQPNNNIINNNKIKINNDNEIKENNIIPTMKTKNKKIINKKIKINKKYIKHNQQINLINQNNINNIIDFEKILKDYDDKDNSIQRMKVEDLLGIKGVIKNNNSNGKLLKLKDFEINSLDYEEAIILDKRSYFEYYISLLKNNHPLTFSFSSSNDYNSRIIKMFLFFFSISLDFTVNTLFFNDDTMNKIYEDKGKFNILYQIPQILYSTVISKVVDGVIRAIALSQDNIVELKNNKEKKNIEMKSINLIRKLKIKFIFFFIFSFIILLFF